MGERIPNRDEWAEAERRASGPKGARSFGARVCLGCGRTIREGAYTGRDGNFRRHARACKGASKDGER